MSLGELMDCNCHEDFSFAFKQWQDFTGLRSVAHVFWVKQKFYLILETHLTCRWTFTQKFHGSKWKFHRVKSNSKLGSHVTWSRMRHAKFGILTVTFTLCMQSLNIYIKKYVLHSSLMTLTNWINKIQHNITFFFLKKKNIASDTKIWMVSKGKIINT